MVEFQVLDVDYIVVNERPIIRIFGKTEDNETVCAFYDDCMPYFYALGEGVENLLANDAQVQSIEKVRRNLVMGFQEPRDVYKITITNPARTPEIRDRLKKRGVKTFEADVLFKYRFMNDRNIRGLGWIDVEESSSIPTGTVKTSKRIEIKRIKNIEEGGLDIDFRILAIDIECVPVKPGGVPEARHDPIIMVSLAFSTAYKGRKTMVLSTRPSDGVSSYSNEKEMLEGLLEIINDYDPDIITGYNINNFDLPYILDRMREYRIRSVFGRCNEKPVSAKKLVARHKIFIAGRVVADSFEIVKKDYSLMRYGLDYVAKRLLKEEKENVKHSQIEKLWHGTREDFKKLVDYSKQDAVLAINLVTKLRLLDKYIALSKVSGTLLQDTLDGGETSRIENFLLREFNRAGYILPCRPEQRDVSYREFDTKSELKGGFVLEPEKRLHSSVVVLDFKSMYPSIIKTFNICPTTLINDMSPAIGDEKTHLTPLGARFVKKDVKDGIIPRIVDRLMKERSSTKKALKKEGDPAIKDALFAKQWALKIMANAFYGHMGYSRARIYNLDIANAITSCGRDMINSTKDEIEKRFGHRVVYGDTDSLMIRVPFERMEEIDEEGRKMSEYITKKLPGDMELEFEKIFMRFLPLTKKRYAAWKFEKSGEGWVDTIETKGIETVRRDWCPLVSDTVRGVLEILLKKNDEKAAVEYFRGVIRDLIDGKINIQSLVITKGMSKNPERYAGIQPHIELVKKIRARNPAEAPGIGDRIGYVIVKGTGLLSKRAEDPAYIREKGLQIDPRYYIDNQLLPPLERVFASLDVSKSELLGSGKQVMIMDIINNMKSGLNAGMQVQRDATGFSSFVCERCSRLYEQSNLSGICECGGRLLFSTPSGPAERVMIENS